MRQQGVGGGFLFLASIWSAMAAPPLDVPFYRQQKNGCGAASIAMVMAYWGKAVETGKVYADLGGGSGGGIELAAMKKYLVTAGFRSFTLRGGWDDLQKHLDKRRPLIVALRPGASAKLHFAVVAGLDVDRVWLNDPTQRKGSEMKRAEFEKQWGEAERWLLVATP